ncbi:MAG: hypothetical protein GQ569_11035 [Methylococcaceae bacterium]|nr:hypothetical protein [Methylococcaceae bacterium]
MILVTSACSSRGNSYHSIDVIEPSNQPSTQNQSRNNNDETNGNEWQAILNYHNKVRADVNVNPLSWSNQVAEHAQAWAKNLAANGCKMQHSNDSNYGENLFMGTLGHYNVVDAAKSWESEKRDYSGAALNSSNWSKTGHYTQMVWHNTTQLGCAKVACNNNLIVVCNYDPAGNYMGQKPY